MFVAPFDFRSHLTWLRIGIALVWLVFGLLFKALDVMPRHREIVGRVIGIRFARAVVLLVALGEICLGLWMLVGRWLWICVLVQTVALVAMNALEIWRARDLLLAPRAMLVANAVLLALGWYLALQSPA